MFNNNLPRLVKILPKVFIISILFIPFITWGGYYEGPKVFLFTILGFSLTFFWLVRVLIQKKEVEFFKVDYWYLMWIFILLLGSLTGVHPLESVIGGSYRHQGVIFFLTLGLVYKTIGILKKSDRQFLNKGVAFAVLAQAIIVFIQYITGRLYLGHPLGTIGETNAVAGFLGIGMYFVFQNLDTLFFAIPVIAILMAESRSGILALMPNTIYIARSLRPKLKTFIIFLLIIGGFIVVAQISRLRSKSAFEDRLLIWKLGAQEIVKRPLLGFGAESGEVVYNSAYKKNNLELNGLIIDRSHNLFMDVAMWSGILGLIAFSGFLINLYKSLDSTYKKAALISFLIYAMFQPLSVAHYLFPFLL